MRPQFVGTEINKARSATHYVFDQLWRDGYMTRQEAYRWLMSKTGLKQHRCHIRYFDLGVCNAVIHLASCKLNDLRANSIRNTLQANHE